VVRFLLVFLLNFLDIQLILGTVNMCVVYVDASPTKTCWVREDGESNISDLEDHTSNQAEYVAILRALLENLDCTELRSDSQLAVRQLNKQYQIYNGELIDLASIIWDMVAGRDIKVIWIPREGNKAGVMLEAFKKNEKKRSVL
jgi:ribonuclease HI